MLVLTFLLQWYMKSNSNCTQSSPSATNAFTCVYKNLSKETYGQTHVIINSQRSLKLVWLISWRNIRAWAYYKMARHLEKFGANRILNIHITNSNESLIQTYWKYKKYKNTKVQSNHTVSFSVFQSIESIGCLFRNVTRS